MSKLSLNTAQGKAVALSGADISNAEPLTAEPTTKKRTTKKAAALTED